MIKKSIAILLMSCFCLCLISCSIKDNTKETQPTTSQPIQVDKIDAHIIYDENVNIAAAQQYVGMETTVVGRIAEIAVDHCKMDVIYNYKKSAVVYLETSVLATFKAGDLKAFTGVLSAADDGGYELINAKEERSINQLFEDAINSIFNYPTVARLNYCNMGVICEYVYANPSAYLTNLEQAKDFISNKWIVYRVGDSGFYRAGYYTLDAFSGKIYDRYSIGSIEVEYNYDNQISLACESIYNTYYVGYAYKMSEDCCLVRVMNKQSWYLLVENTM